LFEVLAYYHVDEGKLDHKYNKVVLLAMRGIKDFKVWSLFDK